MKRVVIIALMLAAISGTTAVNAQSWLRGLGRAAENAAKRTVERNVERATERAIDRVFSETEDAVEDAVRGESSNKGKKNKNKNKNNDINDNNGSNNADAVYDNGDATAQSGQQKPQSVEMAYAKSDFVPGDEIIFEDLLVGEKLGEFPMMWDLLNGNAEIANVGGENVIYFAEGDTQIVPLMENPKNYLPDVFTIELDVYISDSHTRYDQIDDRTYSRYWFRFNDSKSYDVWEFDLYDFGESVNYSLRKPDGSRVDGGQKTNHLVTLNSWNHIAFSFNKRAFKAYINGTRVANVPNVVQPNWFLIQRHNYDHHTRCYIKNIRIAKGAVPLYDRMMTDGKFITYGITFDVGKATIKPESMGEINRIVQLMNENPDLKFSVEGHTDSTGNAASNQTLSEQRSQAIVAKLVELGIAKDRLTAVGKGQNSPIADNSTDEGRAKNRRVEFVKM
ncbi:MAG: OmpA family protein [Alistipes sp.]|nr:OmpA family protein [Alistipes sp.]